MNANDDLLFIEQTILDLLEYGPKSIEDLRQELNLEIKQVINLLHNLLIKEMVLLIDNKFTLNPNKKVQGDSSFETQEIFNGLIKNSHKFNDQQLMGDELTKIKFWMTEEEEVKFNQLYHDLVTYTKELSNRGPISRRELDGKKIFLCVTASYSEIIGGILSTI